METAQQSTAETDGLQDRAATVVSEARETLANTVETVRGRTGDLQAKLADALDSGAQVVRQRAAGLAPEPSGYSPADGTPLEKVIPRVAAQGELAAGLMERGAMWLRENDLSDLESRVMGQLEKHPVRTLGIAAAVGFLVAGRRR